MALTKNWHIYNISIDAAGQVSVLHKLSIQDDGVEISSKNHRQIIEPGQVMAVDPSKKDLPPVDTGAKDVNGNSVMQMAYVQPVADVLGTFMPAVAAIWTPTLVTAFQVQKTIFLAQLAKDAIADSVTQPAQVAQS